jgi:hypothetical protein
MSFADGFISKIERISLHSPRNTKIVRLRHYDTPFVLIIITIYYLLLCCSYFNDRDPQHQFDLCSHPDITIIIPNTTCRHMCSSVVVIILIFIAQLF